MLVRWLFAIAFLAAVTPAMAGADSDAVRKFGLVGTWAPDCAKPPGPNNIYSEFAAPDVGHPIRSYYSQRGRAVFFEMREVRIVAPNRIAYLDVRKSDGDLTNVTIEMADGWQYTVESSDPKDGKVYIKDGILVASGQPSQRDRKCSGP